MDHIDHVNQVREIVEAYIQRTVPQQKDPLFESVLIRDGYYCGRRFRFDGGSADWATDEQNVHFYDAYGNPRAHLPLAEEEPTTRKSA